MLFKYIYRVSRNRLYAEPKDRQYLAQAEQLYHRSDRSSHVSGESNSHNTLFEVPLQSAEMAKVLAYYNKLKPITIQRSKYIVESISINSNNNRTISKSKSKPKTSSIKDSDDNVMSSKLSIALPRSADNQSTNKRKAKETKSNANENEKDKRNLSDKSSENEQYFNASERP